MNRTHHAFIVLQRYRKSAQAAPANVAAGNSPLAGTPATPAGGFKYRHQHPAGPYTLDFYCDEAALCIEVDGIAHDMGDNPERDTERDTWLAAQGVAVLRLPARLILKDMSAALDAVVAAAHKNSSP